MIQVAVRRTPKAAATLANAGNCAKLAWYAASLPAKINGKPPRRQAHTLALGQCEGLFRAHGRDFANAKVIPGKPVPRGQIKSICEVFYACADSPR